MAQILLVEDDPMNRDLIARYLQWEGYQVSTAADGAEAIASVKTQRPDLILMDMKLPIIDGWQATRQLKSSEETRMIPIIALTAYALTEDRTQAMEAGCDSYETKPVDFTRLLVKLREFLGNPKKR
ncbi:MAG: response regulator [Chloroflexi bacterium AL-W]|nr:response regulator [Chloroflexi bacterium AL-N1]NOK65166.1 response regulator [Chloroflexi bacterium AL-N10]NOK72568.1 response regulator [Chloroflexi bacterium AL-N5]NOK79345.1 response regulator [Chloroflexi bacterium AL-W]NOK87261.1 response regulator [Chloroflexi bacterium AL-N15]